MVKWFLQLSRINFRKEMKFNIRKIKEVRAERKSSIDMKCRETSRETIQC